MYSELLTQVIMLFRYFYFRIYQLFYNLLPLTHCRFSVLNNHNHAQILR